LKELETDIRSLEEAGTAEAFVAGYGGDIVTMTGTIQRSVFDPRSWYRYVHTWFGTTQPNGRTGANGVLPGVSRFNDLNEGHLAFLTKVMWIGSMFGYMKNRYGFVNGAAVGVGQHAKTRRASKADALYASYLIGEGYGHADDNDEDLDATVWLCEKYFPGHCQRKTRYLYLTFRGMQLSLGVTTPVLQDVATMLDPNPMQCFKVGKDMLDIEITTGSCQLTTALFNDEGAGSPGVKNAITTFAPQVIFVQGLSFGGAIAQAVTLRLRLEGVQTPMATLLWGAARTGDAAFARKLAEYGNLVDQFISYSYMEQGGPLLYDPVSFWPQAMIPVGNIYTLKGEVTGDGSGLALVHDLVAASPVATFNVKAAGDARFIPALDGKSFNCLHLFTLYRKILGTMAGMEKTRAGAVIPREGFRPLCPKDWR
jgi:hypothetical protein